MIQIDGLSHRQLQRAMEKGRMPFLKRLLDTEGYALRRLYSGLPSTTPAVQGELFYNIPCAVPAFEFRHQGTVKKMLTPATASAVEKDLTSGGDEPLLRGGSSWANIFSGGAAPDETHFCPAFSTLRDLAPVRPWRGFLGTVLFDPVLLARLPFLLSCELAVALADCCDGIRAGESAKEEAKFIVSRLIVGVALRESVAAGASIDLARGLPVIQVNFLGYDERAHRRGPGSAFAHRALAAIDGRIQSLYRKAYHAPVREYDIWIVADHGQETVRSYFEENGPIERTVKEGLERVTGDPNPQFEIAASGPVGHLYLSKPLDLANRQALARWLVAKGKVPGVLFKGENGSALWTHRGGEIHLEHGDHGLLPHGCGVSDWVMNDLRQIVEHRWSGELVLLGWQPTGDCWTFALERGAHGGPGIEETSGFVLAPRSTRFPDAPGRDSLRPTDLRRAALHVLGRKLIHRSEAAPPREQSRSIRVMTYNVHSCIGMDGRHSPQRIAHVLARYDLDLVALQEIDSGRERTEYEEQARIIADELGFEFKFCPAVNAGSSQYGHALLSRFPLEIIHAAQLPSGPQRACEPRAAMLASFEVGSSRVFILNTHFGLGWSERAAQAAEILTENWIGRVPASAPFIVCGDFNLRPSSAPYRRLTQRLTDVQVAGQHVRAANTFPSSWPVTRIDHIFVSKHFQIRQVRVPRNELTRVASDHLPLTADLDLPLELDTPGPALGSPRLSMFIPGSARGPLQSPAQRPVALLKATG